MANGIPALLNGAPIPFHILTQIRAIGNLALDYLGLLQPQYGIYLNNKSVLTIDGVLDFSITNGSQIANYRQEKGAFSSYNKVITPFEIRLLIVRQGGVNEINRCLNDIDKISNDLNLYDIVTKDIVYSNCNLERYNYRKESENGAYTLFSELFFKEILLTNDVGYSAPTKTESAKKVNNGGQVQKKAIVA